MARRQGAAARDPRPPANPRSARDPNRMARYRAAQDAIKTAAPGSPEFEKARNTLERVGKDYGLNWQQWVPAPQEQAPAPTPAPSPYPTEETSPVFAPPPAPAPMPEAPPMDLPGPGGAPGFGELTPGQQADRLQDISGGVFQGMAGYASMFNPMMFQQQYTPQFNEAMDRAYNAVYGQFQQRNEAEFQRQNQEFAQMAAERGLDPNSEAYKTLSQQLADRQDRARQEAQNAAMQAAQGVQQQAFGQAQTTAMLPGQIAGQFAQPGLVGLQGYYSSLEQARQQQFAAQQAAYERQFGAGEAALERQDRARQAELQRQFGVEEGERQFQREKAILRQSGRQAIELARSTPRGGGGGGAPAMGPFDAFMEQQILQGYQPSPQQPSAVNAAIQGVTSGIGAGLTGALR